MKALNVLGYGSLAVASLLYLVLLSGGLSSSARGGDAVGAQFWFAVIFGLPFLAALSAAASVATARGGFDWAGVGRGALYTIVLVGCVAVTVVTVLGIGLRGEPTGQLPLAMRPLMAWAIFVIPPITLIGIAVSLAALAVPGLPVQAVRGLLVGAAAVSGLALIVLIGEGFTFPQRQQMARLQERTEFDARRDSLMLTEVAGMDPATDFIRLLNFTNPYERPQIRGLALEKVNAREDFTAALAASVDAGGSGEVLTYLAGNDPPDPAATAPIAAQAILGTAAFVRRQMEQAHILRNDDFDGPIGRALMAADRLSGQGVDFTAAVRELRQALDTPRAQAIDPPVRRTLDDWLAKHGAPAPPAR